MAVDPKTMDDLEREAHARLLMQEELARTQPVANPVAILTGGQPGSGKSYIVRSVGVEFENLGGVVKIDPDEVRPTLPYMQTRIAAGDLDIPDAAYSDAGTIAYKMIQVAKAERRNVVIDGTLQNTDRALGLAAEMEKAGYTVEFRGMAVPPDLSHARTYTRREEQIASSPTGFGRGVGDDFHDQAVDGYRKTVEAFQTKSAVRSMTFYSEGRKAVETKLVNGQWTPNVSMKDELDRAQNQPDVKAMMAASDSWWMASRLMKERHADPAEIQKIDGYKHFAALREKYGVKAMMPTSVSASITMPSASAPAIADPALSVPPSAPAAAPVQAAAPPAIDPDHRTLAEPAMLAVAKIVHEGIARSGRDPDKSMMNVMWTPDITYLDIRTPTDDGRLERFRLPGHDKVEQAFHQLGAGGVRGILDVYYPDREADAVRNLKGDIAPLLDRFGIEAADLGTRTEPPAPAIDASRTTGPKPAIAASIIASRSGQGL